MFFIFQTSYSQVEKFKGLTLQHRMKDTNEKWLDWSVKENIEVPITIDKTNNEILLSGSIKFNIISEETYINKNGTETKKYSCLNVGNEKLYIEITKIIKIIKIKNKVEIDIKFYNAHFKYECVKI